MNVPLKAVVIGVALAALIVFCHLLFPVLLVLLMLGLIRRVWFGSRHHFAYDGHNPGWSGMRRQGHGPCGSRHMPTIDGGPWLQSNDPAARTRNVQWI